MAFQKNALARKDITMSRNLIDWERPSLNPPDGEVTHPTNSEVKVKRDKKGWHFTIPSSFFIQKSDLVHALLPNVSVPDANLKGKKPVEITIPLKDGDPAYIASKIVTFAEAVKDPKGSARHALYTAYDTVRGIIKTANETFFGDAAHGSADKDGKTADPYEVDPKKLKGYVVAQAEEHDEAGATVAILYAGFMRQIGKLLSAVRADAEKAKAEAAAASAEVASLRKQVGTLGRLVEELQQANGTANGETEDPAPTPEVTDTPSPVSELTSEPTSDPTEEASDDSGDGEVVADGTPDEGTDGVAETAPEPEPATPVEIEEADSSGDGIPVVEGTDDPPKFGESLVSDDSDDSGELALEPDDEADEAARTGT